MPAFLEAKLKSEYPGEPAAPYKIMNDLGYMHGNKETPAGAAAQKQHMRDSMATEHAKVKARQRGQTRALEKL